MTARRFKLTIFAATIGIILVLAVVVGALLVRRAGPVEIADGADLLDRQLRRSLGVSLPNSFRVTRAAKAGLEDPAYFYDVQAPSEEIELFWGQVSAATNGSHIKVLRLGDVLSGLNPRPTWWDSKALSSRSRDQCMAIGDRECLVVIEVSGGFCIAWART